jgi:hypothetical protein
MRLALEIEDAVGLPLEEIWLDSPDGQSLGVRPDQWRSWLAGCTCAQKAIQYSAHETRQHTVDPEAKIESRLFDVADNLQVGCRHRTQRSARP